jgi:hypothetical protein
MFVTSCSTACFKLHRAHPCGPSSTVEPSPAPVEPTASSVESNPLPNEIQLDDSNLSKLDNWSELQQWLSAHPQLRDLISELDQTRASKGPKQAVDALQRLLDSDPRFSEFVHAMLIRVGARDPNTSSLAPIHQRSEFGSAQSVNGLPAMAAAAATLSDPFLHSGSGAAAKSGPVVIRSAQDWEQVDGPSIFGLPMELTGDPLDPAYLNRYLALRAELRGASM